MGYGRSCLLRAVFRWRSARSTDQAFVEFGAAVEVAEFTRQESLAYLRARTGLDDQIGANAVAHELGDLPLGVAQAAATIRRQHLTYTIYLQRLRQVSVNALLGRVSGGDYPHPTAAALLLSIEAAEADDPTGLLSSLLRALADLVARWGAPGPAGRSGQWPFRCGSAGARYSHRTVRGTVALDVVRVGRVASHAPPARPGVAGA